MENNITQPNKVLIAISAIIICLLCGIGLVIPDEPLEWPLEYFGFVFVYILIVFLIFPFWIKSIWNNIVPAISSLKEIGYLQALGLTVLVSILTVLIPE